MSPGSYFSLFYLVFTVVTLFPPYEFESLGLTVESIFQSWLGSEIELFVLYHIKRINLTLLFHSCLPLGYLLGHLFVESFNSPRAQYLQLLLAWSKPWQALLLLATFLPIIVAIYVWKWSRNGFTDHPLAKQLTVYSTRNTTWRDVASDINVEFRRVNKVTIRTSPIQRVLVTDNWILKISLYSLNVAHQSDTAVIISSADVHDWTPHANDSVQFIDIEVKPTRSGSKHFNIRLNVLDLKDFRSRIIRPITVLQHVRVRKSLTERFLETFTEEVNKNPTYEATEELEQCIGCMQAKANVKLRKMCEDDSSHRSHCTNCYCKPMWCVDCMGRWFASRQEKEPSTWLSSKCGCPLCRSQFCILDVSPVVDNS